MNPTLNYFIASLLTAAVSFILAVFVLSRNPKSKLHRTFFFYTFSIFAWSLPFAFMAYAPTERVGLLLGRVFNLGVSFIGVCFMHFVLILLNVGERKRQRIVKPHYIIAVIFTILIPTKLMIAGVAPKFGLNYFINPGPLYYVYVLWWVSCVMYGMFRLFLGYKNSTGARQNQLKYLFFGSFIGYVLGPANFLLVFDIKYPFYPFGSYGVPIYAVITAYAILKYRLMDIRLAVTRAGIFFVVYTLVLGLPVFLGLETGFWIWAMVLMAVLATPSPFIYNYLRRRAENILLAEQVRYQKALRELAKTMTQIRNLDELLKITISRVYETVNPAYAGLYVFSKDENAYVLKYNYQKTGDFPLEERIEPDSSLIKDSCRYRKPFFPENFSLRHEALIIPCFMENNLFTFLILGPKPKEMMYSDTDILIFEVLSSQASLAIENCLFWQEEKVRLAREEQIRRQRAMDHFSASLAHEIDNPIYAIMGLAHVIRTAVVEDLKDTVAPDKINHLDDRLSRLIKNIERISKMIKAIREFSSQTKGEQVSLKLDDVLEDFLSIVGPQFKYEGIVFDKEVEAGITLSGNKIHLEEVLINLATNAIHAVKHNNKKDKKISLKAYRKGSKAFLIEFKDNGYGVKKELSDDVFLDFVTTKASTEGTGMGLARVRKIIENHKGKIWLDSKGEGKGAAFFIELPLKKTGGKNG